MRGAAAVAGQPGHLGALHLVAGMPSRDLW
jgi:hypothetical protein